MNIKLFTFLFISVFISKFSQLAAQKNQDGGAYMTSIEEHYRKVKRYYLFYNDALVQNKERLILTASGNSFLKTLKKAQKKVSKMPAYAGDASLRDSAANYLDLYYKILTQKYNEFLDTEEIIEQSLDVVEAVLLAEDLANIKFENAKINLEKTKTNFAKNHQVEIIEKQEIDLKFEETVALNNYYRSIFLIFLKTSRQERMLWESISQGNINIVEQQNYTLGKLTEEGLAQLKLIPGYKEDSSLVLACHPLLQFYQNESKEKIPFITDYLIKEERLRKIDEALVARNISDENQNEMDLYNIAVSELKEISFDIENDNIQLSAIRLQLLENWYNESDRFLRRHTPRL